MISKKIFLWMPVFVFSACTLDIPIEDKVADPRAIVDASSARKALATAYADFGGVAYMREFSAMSDDFVPTPELAKDPYIYGCYWFREEQLAILAQNIWNNNYQTIMYLNALLNRLSNIASATQKERNEIIALKNEALTLKALCYFHLMRIFAPRYNQKNKKDPGIITKNHEILEERNRITLEESADTIRNLLTTALASDKWNPPSKNWISKTTAACLLAELELWTGNHNEVIKICEPLLENIKENIFQEPVYRNLWRGVNCEESLFDIDRRSLHEDAANIYKYWGDPNYFVLNKNIFYSEGDVRKNMSYIPFRFPVNFGQSYIDVSLFGKYSLMYKQKINVEKINYYRTSNVVFMCAEAYIHAHNPGKAINLMNIYLKGRNAARIPPHTGTDAVLDSVFSEKRKEFLGEGCRFFDLKRLGKTPLKRPRDFTEENIATEIDPENYRWTLPIPPSEFRYNRKVVQNKGWEHMSEVIN